LSLSDLLASTDMDAMYKQMKIEVNASNTQKYYKSKEVQDLDNSNDVVDEY
jgi:transposase